MSRVRVLPSFALVFLSPCMTLAQSADRQAPIIDMHLHAHTLDMYGTPPPAICTNDQEIAFPGVDPRQPLTAERVKTCSVPLHAPATDADLLRATIEMLERYNMQAVTTGSLQKVSEWRAAAPARIIPAVPFDDYEKETPEAFRRLYHEGAFKLFAEISAQYHGLSPTDESLEPYFALAEELDIPVGIHMGEGNPGAPYRGYSDYRARLTSPFLLEQVLIRHPRLRIYVMHYGSPLVDEMIAMLFSHPQLYVDIAGNNWMLPRKQFHSHLRRLVEAGFGKRILFGTDAMVWPQAIAVAIESIESADFLTTEQKRDIFYNNAARFLRLNHEDATHRSRN